MPPFAQVDVVSTLPQGYSIMRWLRIIGCRGPHGSALVLAAVCAPALAMAQQGTISGRVTAALGNLPVAEARVFVVGTHAVASTNSDGHYTMRAAPGNLDVQVIRIGFIEQKRTITLPPGGSVTLDFALSPSLVTLTEIVTTATGAQRRVELGNSVQTLGDIGKKVETAPVTNLSDLLVAKAPGVQVLAGNMTGSAPTIRIRGIKSLSLSSEPIYVIDGVRMNSASINIGTASAGNGTTASYLNVLNPEEIADIEIVKGPSAATLYGTDAANGVIVITTKKGAVGPARWTMHAGGGLVQDRNDYPTQYALWGHTAAKPTTPARCLLVTVASGACIPDSTTSYNLLNDASVSPVANGNTKEWGAQVSGGSDIVRYFLSGDFEGEKGTLTMPSASQQYLGSQGIAIRDEWMNPEYFGRTSLRANLNASLTPQIDVAINTGYTRSDQRLPPVDNNTISYLFQAFGNPGFKPTVACQATPVSCLGYTDKGGLGEELLGYAQYTPANMFQRLNALNIDRFITSANAQWRPLSWLMNDATVGMDDANRENVQLCRFSECPASGTTRQGFVFDSRSIDRNISGKLSSTATWQATRTLNLRTTLGADYTNKQTEFSSAEGDNLPPGAQTAGAGASQFANSSFIQADKTLGYYGQEQFGLRDLLFVTLAARSDQNSAFGTNFQRVFYPKVGVSYILSDEAFFPKYTWLNQLRLRGAYGASGVQPGSITALQTFTSSNVSLGSSIAAPTGTDAPGLLANALGNPKLRPERSTEREFGFEAGFFNRINLDFTYYNNVTKDALISLPIAASAAPSALTVTSNIGSVRNTGLEATVTTAILDRPQFGWNLTVGGSHNTNKIETLGFDANGKPNPTIGTGANRDSVGFPIRGVYSKLYTYADANGNGIIEPGEVKVDANFSYLGYSVPRDLVTVQNSFDFFHKKLMVNVLLDYKGGFSIFDNSISFLCQQKDTCYDETHAASGAPAVTTASGTSSLADQARLVALRYDGTSAGYWENGQFWRLREVGATIMVPQSVTNRMRAADASLTFSARNLHVWTSYRGTDPESNFSVGNVQADLLTTAPPSYFTVRLNLHY
ncbi:MAG: SusC/RagA family TonB-linked outer membrane protein [Gemmatimonadales bacterium]